VAFALMVVIQLNKRIFHLLKLAVNMEPFLKKVFFSSGCTASCAVFHSSKRPSMIDEIFHLRGIGPLQL